MASFLRILLWVVVAVAPGGILLVPLLAADAWRRRRPHALPAGEPALANDPC